MCLYPTIIRNPKYKENAKNGGIIPTVNDYRQLHVPIGCGECMECRKQRARGWAIRLQEDIKEHKNGKFIALTFSNESIKKIWKELNSSVTGYSLDNAIATYGMRHFLEMWRKKYKKSLRHFAITELGHNGTENIHIHAIVWTNENFDAIRNRWQYGWIYPRPWEEKKNYVSERSINYIIKYFTKKDFQHKNYKSIILTSPGIGSNYISSYNAKLNAYSCAKTDECYTTKQGWKIAMPTYWRNKIYSEEEREKLWTEKLNKQIRYVGGEKIDISQNEKEYWKILKYYQKKNKELGFGNNNKDWTRIKYENELRQVKIWERIKNAKTKNTIEEKLEYGWQPNINW